MINKEQLEEFYKQFLDYDYNYDEVFFMFKQARKKYHPEAQGDPVISRKLIRTNNFERFYQKVYQLWHTPGFNKQDELIPDIGQVIYFDLNSKSMARAFNKFSKEFLDKNYAFLNQGQAHSTVRNADIMFMSAIHRSYQSGKKYFLIDIDNPDYLQEVLNIFPFKQIWISKTKNGYHIIINREQKNTIYVNLNKHFSSELKTKKIELKKDCMTPLPGTLQGGFEVRRIRSF